MATLFRDLRLGARTLLRTRFVTVLAVLAFALGIGITSAVFSIFNGVLLKPLPYPKPDQLVTVFDTQPACSTCPASFPKYTEWKRRNTVFSAIGGLTQASFTVTGLGDPARLSGYLTTASLRDVFGVAPELGRWYTEEEDQFGGPLVVVLSHEFWMRQFNGDRTVLGTRLIVDGKPYEVIGVVPPNFTARRVEVYFPLQRKLDPTQRGHFMQVYARLKDDVSPERATSAMRALGVTLAPEFNQNHGIDVRSYYEVVVGNVRTSLQMLMGAVVLVLLIACANVANLLLASGMARQREFAIKMTLGAGLRDIARQLTIEGVLWRAGRFSCSSRSPARSCLARPRLPSTLGSSRLR
jgi:putative ABC transport system permease protein